MLSRICLAVACHAPGALTRRLRRSHRDLIPLGHDPVVTVTAPSSPLRSLLALAATTIALAAPAAVTAATALRGETVDQGVVQSVTPTALELRRLDGTAVTVSLGPATTVRVNGRAASIEAIVPGDVARAAWTPGQPARLVQVSGVTTARTDQGVIVSRAGRRIVLRTDAGATVTVRLGPRTLLRKANGTTAAPRLLAPGATVRATGVPGQVAQTIVVLARG